MRTDARESTAVILFRIYFNENIGGVMFGFLKGNGKNKQLEEIMQRLQMNVANNYKDAAQLRNFTHKDQKPYWT